LTIFLVDSYSVGVAVTNVEILQDAQRVRVGLGPVRRQILETLGEPDSATGLAKRLGMPRQKVNYHLRELERAGLVELHDQRQRRGLTERRLRTSARAWVVDPTLLGPQPHGPEQLKDRYSSAYQVQAAAQLIGEVATQREKARAANQRLATLTLETEIAFASPRDFRAFSEDLQLAIAQLVERYHRASGRRHKLLVASHPAPMEERTNESKS
jgi:DNA-binding transcriptional ArsR family regulator